LPRFLAKVGVAVANGGLKVAKKSKNSCDWKFIRIFEQNKNETPYK